jgi:hypothetical protein
MEAAIAVHSGRASQELGHKLGGPLRAVGGDREIVELAADLGGDRLADIEGRDSQVVHVPTPPAAVRPVPDVVVLLEVPREREVQERPAAGSPPGCRAGG